MIPLLQTKTADTAHTEILASVTRPFSQLLGGAWGQGYRVASILPCLLMSVIKWGFPKSGSLDPSSATAACMGGMIATV